MRTNIDAMEGTEEERTRTRTDTRALDPKLQLLRQVSLFDEFEEESLSALAAHATLKTYGKSAVIVRKGDASRSLLIVASGLVEAVLESPGTERVRLCEFRKGDYFGEMSLIDGAPRSATAIAVEASEILEVDSEAVLAQLTTPMSRKLLKELAARVRRTDGTAKTELFERYIASPDRGVRYEQFDAEVVFEAVDTFVELAAWGRVDGLPSLSHAERLQLLAALGFVVRTLGDVNDAALGGAQSLFDRKLRDTFYLLLERTDGADRAQLFEALERILEQPASTRARDNAALILASVYPKATPAVRNVLAGMMLDTQASRAAAGAIALANLGDVAAWKRIQRALEDPSTRYAYAATLAQLDQERLRKLAAGFRDGARFGALVQNMRAAVLTHSARNCYEQRYDRWLMQCLDGTCGAAGVGPIGGDRTLTGG